MDGPQSASHAARARRRAARLATLALLPVALAACGSLPAAARSSRIQVVAAENFWGSIATQIGGEKADVTSIISSPAADPHTYEPTAADGRALATAQLAIVNGLGYDPWAPRLLNANPVGGRRVINVGKLLRLPSDANPHRWYDPAEVSAVASAIAADLARLDPGDAGYYTHRSARFRTDGLRRYHALIGEIRARFGGTAVGASENIFALLAPALGLRLLTPPGLMRAVGEGTEVTAQDLVSTQRQIADRRIRLWVYNSQNTTPQVTRLTDLARANAIPVATVTETLTPEHASFQAWQTTQLQNLLDALDRG